ncbi:MAG: hypothetical protein ABJO97_10950 [Roseibium sp.]|uniref:hypothetical protein n=1 Tax=Roseibium sp. TaxID=1936156 RepID=UPI003267FAB3
MRYRKPILKVVNVGVWTAAAAILSVLPLATEVYAQARPDTRTMTCAQAQALVKQRGEIVMTTGPNTFERFIADARFCYSRTPLTAPAFAPTKDNQKCAVGKRCRQQRNYRD